MEKGRAYPRRRRRRGLMPPMTGIARKRRYQGYAHNYNNRRQNFVWSME